MSRTKKLVVASVLIAVKIILDRVVGFEIGTSQRITFSFIALVVSGALLGPLLAGLSSGVADIIGFVLKPTGPYFPGFTLTAVLGGVVYGLFFYRKKISLGRIILANSLVSLVLNLLVNSYWIHLMYGPPFLSLLIGRAPFALVLLGVKIVVQALILPRLVEEIRRSLKIRAA